MKFRHEWKHEINYGDMLLLRSRFRAVAEPDPHGAIYQIRSLYFDTPSDKALREKLDGVDFREKFRIRLYNFDSSFIRLEKKSKLHGLCSKESAQITKEEVEALLSGAIDWLTGCDRPLLQELGRKMVLEGLRPKTIVDYTREAFLFPAGNVRLTLDYHISTGLSCCDLLDVRCPTIPVEGAPIVLEVKWDEFLPDVIRDVVQLKGRRTSAFSKYAACRMYD